MSLFFLKSLEVLVLLNIGTRVSSQGIHVDLPGQHGNLESVPVVHRDGGSQGSHVDLPGQHGNFEPVPVIHRDRHVPISSVGGVSHVDLPGQHGNLEPVPVIHRDGGIHVPGGGSHVDLPGQHGNLEPVPIVHRGGPGILKGGSHVDLPGQHGNLEPVPVVHRDGLTHAGSGGSHVDLPGQHGNLEPVPVVHRQGGISDHGIVRLTPGIGTFYPPGRRILVGRNIGDPLHGRLPGYRGRGLHRAPRHMVQRHDGLVGGGLAQVLANAVVRALG